VQLLEGLLRQGGFSAQDPGKVHMHHAEVGAAVDQRVCVVVGGQHPVRSMGSVWRCKETGSEHWYKSTSEEQSLQVCNKLHVLTLKEGDLQH